MKKKILLISDHAFTTSGVATQSLHLVQGLLNTDKYNIVQIGAAMYHESYDTRIVNENFKIIPTAGFGSKSLIENILKEENPDCMIIFSDSRYFTHVFEMSEDIRKTCPIFYWHVWDNKPVPYFNKKIYDSVDHVACISRLTYSICQEIIPNKCSYIPHSLPESVFFKMEKDSIYRCKEKTLGSHRKDNFVCLWLNRNIKRKRPADVLKSWQMFLFKLQEKYKHKNATLIMHTNPNDKEGNNLLEIVKYLKIEENVCFSNEMSSYDQINALHNISDVCLNISHSEGFGLSTLESMQVGTPIIANLTGGLINQVIDYNDGSENGIGLRPDVEVLTGNQEIPYISENYVSTEKVAKAIFEFYNYNAEKKENLSQKCIDYVQKEYSYTNMISSWDRILEKI